MPRATSRELKDQAGRLKDGVSELAVEGYFQAKQEIEAGADDVPNSGTPELPGGVLQNGLMMADSKL